METELMKTEGMKSEQMTKNRIMSMDLFTRCDCMPHGKWNRKHCDVCRWMEAKTTATLPYKDPRHHFETNRYPYNEVLGRCLCMKNTHPGHYAVYNCNRCANMVGYLSMTKPGIIIDSMKINTDSRTHERFTGMKPKVNIKEETRKEEGELSSSASDVLTTPPPLPVSTSTSSEPAPQEQESPLPPETNLPDEVTMTSESTQVSLPEASRKDNPPIIVSIKGNPFVKIYNFYRPFSEIGQDQRSIDRRCHQNYRRRQRRRSRNDRRQQQTSIAELIQQRQQLQRQEQMQHQRQSCQQ